MMVRGLLVIILFCFATKPLAAQRTIHFLKHVDTAYFSDCDLDDGLFTIHVYNSSDLEQKLWISLPGTSTNARNENGVLWIPPLDTVWVILPKWGVTYYPMIDTVRIWNDHGMDSMFLVTQRFNDSIEIKGDLDIDRVKLNDSVYKYFEFSNFGVIPYPFTRTHAGGLIIADTVLDDTLLVGERRGFWALVDSRSIGRKQAFIVRNWCLQPEHETEYRVYNPKGYFSQDLVGDSSVGCAPDLGELDYHVTIKNDSAPTMQISSLTLSNQWWSFMDSSWKHAIINEGDSLVVLLIRNVFHSSTVLSLETTEGTRDAIVLRTHADWSLPRFYIEIDTLRFNGRSGDERFHQFTLTAEGNHISIIDEIELSDTIHWKHIGVNAGDTLQFGKIRSGEVRFTGADVSGDYPVTLTVRTSPCDTVLTRTIIMSLTASDVSLNEDQGTLRIYPLPAAALLNVEAPINAELKLLDILGRTLIEARAKDLVTSLDVQGLPAGSYVLVVTVDDVAESRIVTIEH